MSDQLLLHLARAAGINSRWTDTFGHQQQVPLDTLKAILNALSLPAHNSSAIRDSLKQLEERQRATSRPPLITGTEGQPLALQLPCLNHPAVLIRLESGTSIEAVLDSRNRLPPLPCGYHHLELGDQQIILAIAPSRCPDLPTLTNTAEPRLWGLATQLYSLRGTAGDLGDAAALVTLCRQLGLRGADAVGISPVHAMASAEPSRYSPYSPSSRRYLNVLYGSPEAVLGPAAVRQALADSRPGEQRAWLHQASLAPGEETELIDWPAVTALRMDLLRVLHRHFIAAENPLHTDLHDFIQQGGEALHQYCCFEALSHHLVEQGHSTDWRHWPSHWQDPASAAVQHFAYRHSTELHFHAFAQWIAARSLSQAQAEARHSGMRIGLISDLAVGVHGGGADTWARRQEFLPGVTIGAPPDVLNQQGQNWSLAALSPSGIVQQGFQTFIDMLRANFAYAGGMRIDHIMGLQRLWVIPPGMSPQEGAYLDYPFLDQLRLLALEARRHNALVIGEDLGTVPAGLRETLAEWNILGTRVLFFEQREGRYPPPQEWSDQALATTTTHDLPSVLGWFKAHDIAAHVAAGHRDEVDAEKDLRQRHQDAAALTAALDSVSGSASSVFSSSLVSSPSSPDPSLQSTAQPLTGGFVAENSNSQKAILDACIAFVGQTPAPLVLLPAEDLLALETQPNLPGPGDTHPNWRRRYPAATEQLFARREVSHRLDLLATVRAKAGSQP